MSRSLKDVLEDFRKSSYVTPSHIMDPGGGRNLVVLDWSELESAINYYIQTEVLGQKPQQNKVGYERECTVCKRVKAPRGRSAAVHGSYCDDECPGYRLDPKPGDLWPGETAEEFGFACEP